MLGHKAVIMGDASFRIDSASPDFYWGWMTLSCDSAVIAYLATGRLTQSIRLHCRHCSESWLESPGDPKQSTLYSLSGPLQVYFQRKSALISLWWKKLQWKIYCLFILNLKWMQKSFAEICLVLKLSTFMEAVWCPGLFIPEDQNQMICPENTSVIHL